MSKKFYIAPYPIHRWAIFKTGDIRISDVYTLKSKAEDAFDRVTKNPHRYMKKDCYRQLVYKIIGLSKQVEDLGYEWPEKWQAKALQPILDSKTPKRLEGILKEVKEFIEEHNDG